MVAPAGRQRQHRQQVGPALPDHVVDQELRRRRQHEAHDTVDEHQAEPEGQAPPVRPDQDRAPLPTPSENLNRFLSAIALRYQIRALAMARKQEARRAQLTFVRSMKQTRCSGSLLLVALWLLATDFCFCLLSSVFCILPPCAASSTSTWTRSTRPSNSATGPSCAAGPWPSAAGRTRAAWWPPRATRRGPSACGRRCRWRRAVRLCPAPGHRAARLREVPRRLRQVFALFRAVTPLVEPLSLDEAYLDVTENAWGEPLAVNVAKRLKAQIREATGLTASAGVAPNKFLAKIASGWQKPDGLTVVAPERVEAFLQTTPDRRAVGRRPRDRRPLRSIGLERLVDVRQADPELLRRTVGSHAEWLVELAHGIDDRPVEPDRPRKSVGTENTFAEDLTDLARIGAEIAAMARGRRGVARPQEPLRAHRDDQGPLRRLHDHHAQRHAAAGHARRRQLARRAVALLDRTEAGDAAGPAAGRQPARPRRPPENRRRMAKPLQIVGAPGRARLGGDGPTAAPWEAGGGTRTRRAPALTRISMVARHPRFAIHVHGRRRRRDDSRRAQLPRVDVEKGAIEPMNNRHMFPSTMIGGRRPITTRSRRSSSMTAAGRSGRRSPMPRVGHRDQQRTEGRRASRQRSMG